MGTKDTEKQEEPNASKNLENGTFGMRFKQPQEKLHRPEMPLEQS